MTKPHITVRDDARLDIAVDAMNALSRLSQHYRFHQPMFDPDPMAVSFGDVAPLLSIIEEQVIAALIFDVAQEGE